MLKMSQKKHFGLALPDFSCKIAASTRHRAVAQAGSALRSGRRGRRFESCQLDSENPQIVDVPMRTQRFDECGDHLQVVWVAAKSDCAAGSTVL